MMSAAGHPTRLKRDAVAEALLEVRFDSEEVADLVVGFLANHEPWRQFNKERLPASDVPEPIRMQDGMLRHLPLIQCSNTDRTRVVKIGTTMISYHILKPYPGWSTAYPEWHDMLQFVFQALGGFTATRLGFRYVNAFYEQDHHVSNAADLQYSIRLDGRELDCPFNLNYLKNIGEQHRSLVRIASPEFVASPQNISLSALVDIDIFTSDDFRTNSVEQAKDWLANAHEFVKDEFFSLIPPQILNRLREE